MADILDFEDEEERKRRAAGGAPEFSYESIQADPWSAVYGQLPQGADAALLRYAYDKVMQCAGAVAGPPSPALHPFAPETIGADKSREENFEHAVRRLDELDSRLRPAMLDDEAARQAAPKEREDDEPRELPPMKSWREDNEFLADVFTWSVSDQQWWFNRDEATIQADYERILASEHAANAARQAPEQQPAADIAPEWRQVENDWHMIVGNETVAALMPNSDATFPQYKWLSAIVCDDYPDHGWSNVDFETLEGAQHVLEQWWHHARQGEAYRPETHDKEPIAVETANQNDREPMTIEAIERDPSNAVKLDIPQDASLELLEHARKAAAHEVERIEDYIQYDREDIEDGAVEERKAAQARIAELDERLEPAISPAGEISRPLGAAELAERVRRIIEDPSLADAERDDRVLQVVEERREEQSQAEPAKQDDAPQVDSSQEPETQSSADRDAAEVDWLFGREEMTEARSAAYDRFTGQELSPRTGQSAGPAQEAGQSQSHSKGRSR